ncbi:BURP domain-containing protein 9 isoform X3 [Brachypodium distachyon]|uniref:BURP domain-containing protein n=1 Tax=Brachypodium distachyon TaxID=15368 RepID=A0A2K2DQK2_BRADI|nr:BURP domain-containing protein 9 isoform X3 [Brachypodium distachyon]PNT76548.1 hypothetical protein BRADI_1g49322v3 [Brachypodium distachyon]|eukprot:XP_024316449.1 BURP domain-containing protein 9 isoform X3 [Brachypodium distachyon]
MSAMLPLLLSSLLLVMAAGDGRRANLAGTDETAAITAYWQTVLPNSPMPSAMLELLAAAAGNNDKKKFDKAFMHSLDKNNDDQKNKIFRYGSEVKTDDQKNRIFRYGPEVNTDEKKTKIFRYGPEVNNDDQKNRIFRYGAEVNTNDQKNRIFRYDQEVNTDDQKNRIFRYGPEVNSDDQNQKNKIFRYGPEVNTDDQKNKIFRYGPEVNTDDHKNRIFRYGPEVHKPVSIMKSASNVQARNDGESLHVQKNIIFRYGPEVNTDDQKNRMFRYGPEVNTDGQKNRIFRYGPEVNTDGQKNQIFRYGPEVNTDAQKNRIFRYGPEVNTDAQKNRIFRYGPEVNTDDQKNRIFRYGQEVITDEQKNRIFRYGPEVNKPISSMKSAYNVHEAGNDGESLHTHGDMTMAFFMEESLIAGSTVTPYIPSSSISGALLLQRDVAASIPMSMRSLTDILTMFAPASHAMANAIWSALDVCENSHPIRGEKMTCATSLESMVEFAASVLTGGIKRDLQALSSPDVPIEGVMSARKYKVSAARRTTELSKSVTCHGMTFPFAVFMCHAVNPTRVYTVTLEKEDLGSSGGPDRMEVLAVCHLDTSNFNPRKMPAHIKPGDAPLCHFIVRDSILWAPATPVVAAA